MTDQNPSAAGQRFLADSGLETTLIFEDGFDLPDFAAFHLLGDAAGLAAMRRYYVRHIRCARAAGFGFILESPTWRASCDWGDRLGYSKQALEQANEAAIVLMRDLRATFASDEFPMVISGCIGPRGDGYQPGSGMRVEAAEAYHDEQIRTLLNAGADVITAMTMTTAEEATGIVRAARRRKAPVVISFTVETDGRLPTGQTLRSAIEQVDAATGEGPAYYMINCAHPTHFAPALPQGEQWVSRIEGIRANASRCSHAELDNATELDRGDPADLAALYRDLAASLPQLRIFGGCCGTNHEHIEAIAQALSPTAEGEAQHG